MNFYQLTSTFPEKMWSPTHIHRTKKLFLHARSGSIFQRSNPEFSSMTLSNWADLLSWCPSWFIPNPYQMKCTKNIFWWCFLQSHFSNVFSLLLYENIFSHFKGIRFDPRPFTLCEKISHFVGGFKGWLLSVYED